MTITTINGVDIDYEVLGKAGSMLMVTAAGTPRSSPKAESTRSDSGGVRRPAPAPSRAEGAGVEPAGRFAD